MGDVSIVALQPCHCLAITPKLRAIDRLECEAILGAGDLVAQIQRMQARASVARAAFVDGELVAIFGVSRTATMFDEGHPWMLGTDAIQTRPVARAVLEHSRAELLAMTPGYASLWNFVYVRNVRAIRWLKWLGFDFHEEPFNMRGHEFLLFSMGEKPCALTRPR